LNTSMRLPDAVRISARGREILIKLKRYTGVGQWNTLCRVAYCYSLAIGTEPTQAPEKGDCALEIEWGTFCGPIKTELAALTVWHSAKDGALQQDIAKYVRAHVERGLGAIQNVRSVAELARIASGNTGSTEAETRAISSVITN
jgi:DNA sulfur modification protein DndE